MAIANAYPTGLGDITEGEVVAAGLGASIPLLLAGGVLIYLLFSGSAANARREALADARKKYSDDVKRIKQEYPRIRL